MWPPPNGPGFCTMSARRSTTRWRARTRSWARILPNATGNQRKLSTPSPRITAKFRISGLLVSWSARPMRSAPRGRERIALSFPGVEKCFALQAGRELRVMVEPAQITDEQAYLLARNIARKIEEELQYPGQIRVTTVRETRCVEFAK